MKKFTTPFSLICLFLSLCFSFNSYAQQQPKTISITGKLIRTTPKLADIDRNSMYGKPLVITRDMDGVIGKGKEMEETEERIDEKIRERLAEEYRAAMKGKKPEVIQTPAPLSPNIPGTSLGVNFNGQTSPGLQPTDNNMAAGPNHVIQIVNNTSGSQFTIWNKSGVVVQPATILASVTGVSGQGDPIVLYDQLANRWFLAEFGSTGGNPNYLVMAVSTTGDPTGSWSIYQYIDASFYPDYPKFSVWHNAYYAYTNDFNSAGTAFLGTSVWAFERTAMLAGNPTAIMLRVRLSLTNQINMGSVGLEGMVPSTQNGLFIIPTSATQLNIFEVTPNFGASTLTVGPLTPLTVNAWSASGAIAQQTGGTLGSLSPRMMFKSSYRNNSGTESIVCTHTIANGTLGQVRWYELRRIAGTWTVFQQGDVPGTDGNSRWMPGISMDGCGNIALMYDVAGVGTPAAHPSVRYTGRNAGDPVNTMTLPESVIINGASGFGGFRWGDYNTTVQDYSAVGVPANGSFWSTSQHGNQLTRVANFTLTGGCAPAAIISAGTATLTAEGCVPNNGVIDPGETVTVSFCVTNTGTVNTTNLIGTMQASGGVTPISGPQNYGIVLAGGPAVCRSFSFSNTSGICGGTITVSIQMQDGVDNLGTLTWTFTLGTTVVASSQNFDAVVAPALPAGWVATNVIGGAPAWVTSNAGTPAPPAVSAPNALFIDDPAFITDKQIVTPSFVPGGGARVSFANNFDLESTYDGGVLEISINGGGFQDIITAGGSFVAGGYTQLISSSFGNVLAGRNAWSGTSGGFITTTINLPAASAGQPCVLKFRMGSDNSFGQVGWRVDNFSVSQPTCCGAACTITCPANITVNTGPGATGCGANVTYPPPTTTGLCGTVTVSPASGSFFPVGTTIVTATSTAGPTCTFTITVVDNTPPAITCPANITRNNDPGLCSAVVTYSLPTIRDNCDPAPVQFPASFAAHGGGTVYSLQGNTLPGGLFFTLTNTTGAPRTINSFGVRFGDPAFGAVVAPQTLTIWSRPGLLTAAIENSTAGWTQQGPQVVNPIPPYFATGTGPLGICGMNSAVTIAPGASASFFIHGQTACPIFNYNFGFSPPIANGGFTLTGGTMSFDVLGSGNHFNQGSANGIINIQVNLAGPISPVLIAGLASGSVFPVGVTTNSYRATDPAGNSSTCSFNVTVVDAQAPTITCPASIVRNTDAGLCTATIAVPNPTTADNCGVTTLTWVMTGATTGSSPATGINFVGTKTFNLTGTTGQGITTIVYTVKDAAGNTTTCSFTVTVNDLVLPVITLQPATKFVCTGSNGVFSVTATANGGPIAYQWQEWNGTAWVNITGATTNSYTVPSVTFTDNTRSFRVILTGLCSVVTSSAATLYVNPLPTITLISSIPPSLIPGQSLNITATGNPAGGTFEWFKNNVLTGHTGSTWTGLTVDDIGIYKVRYTDPNGCVSTSADLTVTGQQTDKLWVYPNPNTGNFQVRLFNQLDESITIRVFDSKGAKVFEKVEVTGTPYSGISIDLSPLLASGVYTVDVRGGGGKFVGAKRIVVRHP